MASDTNPVSMASLSPAQLAERLEKSEAGRKKLRQAIAILQEKLDAMEKVLKVNETLRQECERERQRAESEKQKAEEEKRLKSILEKDSTTFKDQLAKVLQRLGAVENKQKVDKKEIERLRNEVKLSVEGMRVASQAVNEVQSSFKTLETGLLEKVNAALGEAHAATQAIKQVQGSLQSMEQAVIKQGTLPSNEQGLAPAGRAPEKLVDEISRLFNKERQSHCKIEHRLSMLKSVFNVGRRHHPFSNAEKIVDLESLALSKKIKDKVSKKRKSRGEEETFDRRVRKGKECSDVAAVNSVVKGLACIGHKQAEKDQSLISPHSMQHQKTSGEPGSLPIEPRSYNTASNDYSEEAVVEYRGSSNVKAHEPVPPKEAEVVEHKENSKDLIVQTESRGCHKKAIIQNKGRFERQSYDEHGGSHSRKADLEENPQPGVSVSGNAVLVSTDAHFKDANKATCHDLDVETSDDSEEWWWSSDRVLLSPSLPDIPSPMHHSPIPSREPSPCRGCFESVMDSSVSCKVLGNDTSVVCEAANIQGDVIDRNADSRETCNNPCDSTIMRTSCDIYDDSPVLERQTRANASELSLNVSTELGGNVLAQTAQSDHDAGVNVPETGANGEVHNIGNASFKPNSDPLSTVHDTASASCETFPGLDPVCPLVLGHESSVVLDNEEVTQFEVYTFEAIADAPLAEIDEFLEVLPPLPDALPSELSAHDPSLSAPRKLIGSTYPLDKVCKYNQPLERQVLKATDKGYFVDTNEKSRKCTSLEHVIDPALQGLPTQVGSYNFEVTGGKEASSVTEILSGSNLQDTLPLTTKPSTPCEASSVCTVFLLQAFETQDAVAEVNLTAACIVVKNLENHLLHMKAEKGEAQLLETKVYKTIVDLPLEYVACSIISSAVDLVRSEKGGEAASDPFYALLQAYVAFITSMFKETASMMINTILGQLRRFLIQGEAMLVTLQGSITPCKDALGVARVIHDKRQCTYQYFEATLEDLYAGGKVLAALCQVLACVTHLQNIVYEVLGWCDKDIMWLLTVFSSFSSICGHTAFMVEADDLLGQAICAIIIELVASVEQDSGRSTEAQVTATPRPPDVEPKNLVSWHSLKEAVKITGGFSVKDIVLAAMGALQYALGSTQESMLSSDLRTGLLTSKDCNDNDNRRAAKDECTAVPYKALMKDSCTHQEVSAGVCKSLHESFSADKAISALKTLGPQKWQRKYVEAVGALELISHFMGWEWTYNHLIVDFLWKMLALGSTQICAAGVSHILSMLTRIAAKAGGADLPGLADLKQRIFHLVHSTSMLMGKAESILLMESR